MFPSPVESILCIEIPESRELNPNQSIILYEVNGIIVKEANNLSFNKYKINVSDLLNGMYILNFRDTDSVLYTQKVVIVK